jgi:hypothetical protein
MSRPEILSLLPGNLVEGTKRVGAKKSQPHNNHHYMKYNQKTWSLAASIMACAICFLGTASVRADESAETRPDYRPFSIGADAGTAGFGGSVTWRFCDHFGLRAGADYMSYNHSGTIEGVYYTGKLQLASEVLTADWYPWTSSSFHLSGGVAFNENKLTSSGVDNNVITINGNSYGPGQGQSLGTLNLVIKQRLVNAYLSIGGNLLYFDPGHRWALTGELGAMYGGKPKVALTSTGASGAPQSQINADIATEQQKVQHYANYLQFWPEAKLGVSYSF